MATPNASARTSRPPKRQATPWPFIFACLWFAALIAIDAVAAVNSPEQRHLYVVAGVVLLALTPIALTVAWRLTTPSSDGVERRIMELTDAINTATQEGGLSEGAKRVLHRRQERELLRRAIEQDVADEDWDAAMVLVKELAERFGYRADAEEFRARIERARAQTMDRKVVDALARLDEHIRHNQWAEAYAEAARIRRLYPDSHRIDGLRERVDQSRLRFRKELERQFLIAADADRLDDAMNLLKELDQYLSPEEAAPFQEVARGVIGKSRENLGVQFKIHVQDHQWAEAINVGERIVADFPNSRMAGEVRTLLPNLRERAAST